MINNKHFKRILSFYQTVTEIYEVLYQAYADRVWFRRQPAAGENVIQQYQHPRAIPVIHQVNMKLYCTFTDSTYIRVFIYLCSIYCNK